MIAWLIGPVGRWVSAALLSVLLAAIPAAYFYGRSVGGLSVKLAVAHELEEAREREAKAIAAYEAERGRVRVVYRDRIKEVERATDPSGCADQHIPSAILDQLRAH